MGRVDFATMRDGASLAAFVHFLQWRDTPSVAAFQAHLRQCSAKSLDPEADAEDSQTKLSTRAPPPRMPAYTEVEGIPVGIKGTYWLLLENRSKASPALPLPPAAPEEDQVADEEASIAELLLENEALQTALADLQDRVVLQSKRIRDLEREAALNAGPQVETLGEQNEKATGALFDAAQAPRTPVATGRGHMAPPPAPLKRARTGPPRLSEEDAEELREAWKREGLEGPVGDDHDADMAAMSERTVRFADEVLVDARGPVVAMQ